MNVADYSPFGVQLDGRTISNGDYRYGFQGQETDDEIKGEGNSINYKYRMHDPRIGRFFAVDPLVDEYPMYSSYQFSANQVTSSVELEGLESSDDQNNNVEVKTNTETDVDNPKYKLTADIGFFSGNWTGQVFTKTSDVMVDCEAISIDPEFAGYHSLENYLGPLTGGNGWAGPLTDQANQYLASLEFTSTGFIITAGVLHNKMQSNVEGQTLRWDRGGTNPTIMLGLNKSFLNKNRLNIESRLGGYVSINDVTVNLQSNGHSYVREGIVGKGGREYAGFGLCSMGSVSYDLINKRVFQLNVRVNGTYMFGKVVATVDDTDLSTGAVESKKLSINYGNLSLGASVNASFKFGRK